MITTTEILISVLIFALGVLLFLIIVKNVELEVTRYLDKKRDKRMLEKLRKLYQEERHFAKDIDGITVWTVNPPQ